MFSLYVCDIPQNITKDELEKVFSQFNGFHEVRLAKDKNRQRIAFVDYTSPQAAEYAMSSTIGYRFSNSTKGITVRFSENSKNNQPQPHGPNKRRETSQNCARGLNPPAVSSNSSTLGAHINGVVVNEGSSSSVSHRLPKSEALVGGARQRTVVGGVTPSGTQQQNQQRQLSSVGVANSGGGAHSMYQSDPSQQMQQRFYGQQAPNLGGNMDVQGPNHNGFLEQAPFNASQQQHMGVAQNAIGQLTSQQAQNTANAFFGGANQQTGHVMGQQNFQQQTLPPKGAPQGGQPQNSISGNPEQSTQAMYGQQRTLPHLSQFEANPGSQQQQPQAQPSQAFSELAAAGGQIQMERSRQTSMSLVNAATQNPVQLLMAQGITQAASAGPQLNKSVDGQQLQPGQPGGQAAQNAPQDGQGHAAQAAGNTHQDIYNLLSNLNNMASSMASSIVNSNNAKTGHESQAQPNAQAPPTQSLFPMGGDITAQQQAQSVLNNGGANVQQNASNSVLQQANQNVTNANPNTGNNGGGSQPQQSSQNQIQSQLIQSLISTLQQQNQPTSAAPQPDQAAAQSSFQSPLVQFNSSLVQQPQPVASTPQRPQSQADQRQQPSNNGQPQGQNQSGAQPPRQIALQGMDDKNRNAPVQVNGGFQQQMAPLIPTGNQQQQQQQSAGSQHGFQSQSFLGNQVQIHNSGQVSQTSSQQSQTPVAPKNPSLKMSVVQHIQAMFGQDTFCVPKHATNTIYVEGIPTDASEREVSHIFRPFRGFRSVRLIPREINVDEKVLLCFADFETSFQTTLVINTLQGYRFDKDNIWGLQFSYANKQTNALQFHHNKGEASKEVNPTNNNNNSIANRTERSGSFAEAKVPSEALTPSPGAPLPAPNHNNNTSKK